MRNLDEEYITKQIIYSQQKEYRKTDAGKRALRRAKEKQILKQMKLIPKSHGGGGIPRCVECDENRFEVLTINHDVIVCYNCRYERPKVLSEEEICQ